MNCIRTTIFTATVCAFLLLFSCNTEEQKATTFVRLDPAKTGVDFTNITGENDSFNILTNEYIYNGGGVGIGDFDNDGRQDIFFTGNAAENRLYLNRGDWNFEDVTATAGVAGTDRWSGGVTIVDINGDGLDDIYVCASVRLDAGLRANQLFLNQGLNEAGVPTFRDVAAEFNLDDQGHNTQAAWLDYDLDGDLDVFLLVNKMLDSRKPNTFTNKIVDGSGERTDKLYRQDQDDAGNIRFTEVGKETGILFQGFGLGVTVCDLNQDGRPDLYVSNDYLSNDLAYLNTINEDGSVWFDEISADLTKHTSFSAMGNDVADLNNDGEPDIFVVDMLPADNLRRKMMLPANNYTNFQYNSRYGYAPQYGRNTLQVSQGKRMDGSQLPLYAEIGMSAELPATDWSWTPLIADFDLDGNRDIIITNGFPKDITDHDFGDYQVEYSRYTSLPDILKNIPSVKLRNEAFRASPRADGLPHFDKVTDSWGIDVTSFSNGAAYADLDNDGDLDYVVNNLDDPAHIYRNDVFSGQDKESSSAIKITLANEVASVDWMGSSVTLTDDKGDQQFTYWHPHRGYLSSHTTELVFGLGSAKSASTIVINWPHHEPELFGPVLAGETLKVAPGTGQPYQISPKPTAAALVQSKEVANFIHKERDYIDFNVQPMLLRKTSQQGPAMAVSDLNGDGYDDLYLSGSFEYSGRFFFGGPEGFVEKADDQSPGIPAGELIDGYDPKPEELGSLFFDADGDGDDDLYIVSGSYELTLDEGDYRDRLYRNEGGSFSAVDQFVEGIDDFSGSAVKAVDYDQDGDLDLFVGGRVVPHSYPMPVNSYLLKNESTDGRIRFTIDEQATEVLASLTNATDAIFTDYDNDGRPDLLVTGEWAPLRLFRNTTNGWEEVTESVGLSKHQGWWNGLTAGDFDNDGDTDYVVGNYGENTLFRTNTTQSVEAYLVDLDLNGAVDFIPSTWLADETGELKRFPYFNRNDFAKQLSGVKGRHKQHIDFARAEAQSYELTEEQAKDNPHYFFRADKLQHVYLENTPDGFVFHTLPATAQTFPVFGMQAADLNGDEWLDLMMIGNDWGNEVGQGAMDAGNGLVLLGTGQNSFTPLSPDQSGLYVPGEGRALARLNSPAGSWFVASQNSGPLVFIKPLKETAAPAARKVERYWGSAYLSQ